MAATPVLVLTRDEAIDRLNEVFVVLATTNIRGLPTEVELGPDEGMPRACVLNTDNVASLPKGYLGDVITTLRDAGRSALADQESLVTGIRNRTATLLAANALVASFLGATTVRARGFHDLVWLAIAALVLALVDAAILLAPWKLKFAVDARELYKDLYPQAVEEAQDDTLGWLAAAGYGYQDLRQENATKVRWMSWLSGALGALMVLQTMAWLVAVAVD